MNVVGNGSGSGGGAAIASGVGVGGCDGCQASDICMSCDVVDK